MINCIFFFCLLQISKSFSLVLYAYMISAQLQYLLNSKTLFYLYLLHKHSIFSCSISSTNIEKPNIFSWRKHPPSDLFLLRWVGCPVYWSSQDHFQPMSILLKLYLLLHHQLWMFAHKNCKTVVILTRFLLEFSSLNVSKLQLLRTYIYEGSLRIRILTIAKILIILIICTITSFAKIY